MAIYRESAQQNPRYCERISTVRFHLLFQLYTNSRGHKWSYLQCQMHGPRPGMYSLRALLARYNSW